MLTRPTPLVPVREATFGNALFVSPTSKNGTSALRTMGDGAKERSAGNTSMTFSHRSVENLDVRYVGSILKLTSAVRYRVSMEVSVNISSQLVMGPPVRRSSRRGGCCSKNAKRGSEVEGINPTQ